MNVFKNHSDLKSRSLAQGSKIIQISSCQLLMSSCLPVAEWPCKPPSTSKVTRFNMVLSICLFGWRLMLLLIVFYESHLLHRLRELDSHCLSCLLNNSEDKGSRVPFKFNHVYFWLESSCFTAIQPSAAHPSAFQLLFFLIDCHLCIRSLIYEP